MSAWGKLFKGKDIKKSSDSDDWVYVGKTDNYDLYYHKKILTINHQNQFILVNLKSIFSDIGKVSFLKPFSSTDKQKYQNINYTITIMGFDCKELKYNITNTIYYTKSGEILGTFNFSSEWKDLVKDSLIYIVLRNIIEDNDIQMGDWADVGKYDNFTVYYRLSTVKIDEKRKIIRVVKVTVYTENGINDFLNLLDDITKQQLIDLSFELSYYYLSYEHWKSNLIHLTYYDNSGNILLDREVPNKWENISPNTLVDILLNKLLQDYNIVR